MTKGQHKLNRKSEYRCRRPKTAVLSDPMHQILTVHKHNMQGAESKSATASQRELSLIR
jgi:hypothetical protein